MKGRPGTTLIRFISIFTFTLVFTFHFSCHNKKENKKPDLEQLAKLVQRVTDGGISPSSPIRVIFQKNVIKDELVGLGLKKQVFFFEPSITGTTQWKDKQTLEFKPNQPLPSGQSYNGYLDLNALFPELKVKQEMRVPINFSVLAVEIKRFKADLQVPDQAKPKILEYTGEITFTQTVEKSLLEKSAQLTLNGKSLKVDFEGNNKDSQFQFTSQSFPRQKRYQTIKFTLSQKLIKMSSPFERKMTVPAMKALAVQEVKVNSGENPNIQIVFSEPLDNTQLLDGLITVSPNPNVKMKRSGKTVTLYGKFDLSSTYNIMVDRNIRSTLGIKMKSQYERKIGFEDLKPEIEFVHSGMILPSSNKKLVQFRSVNVKRVKVNIKRVYANNILQFMQYQTLNSDKKRNSYFDSHDMRWVGINVADTLLELGDTRNRWLTHQLDLAGLIPEDKGEFYVLGITFTKNDIIYKKSSDKSNYYGNSYYTNPWSRGYYYDHGKIYKPLLMSDIGILYKRAGDTHYIFTTDLITGKPKSGVSVKLYSDQQQDLAEGTTRSDGSLVLDNISSHVFAVRAEANGYTTYMETNEVPWNLSTFDVGGINAGKDVMRSFIYNDRGVYRPGDTIHTVLIIRSGEKPLPDGHPVSVKFYNPKNTVVHTELKSDGADGVYYFMLHTADNDPTGNWLAEFTVGAQKFTKTIKVESVVPYRLKVQVLPDTRKIAPNQRAVSGTIQANYLFGNPASALKFRLDLNIDVKPLHFRKYSGFEFLNRYHQFQPLFNIVSEATLDNQGHAAFSWKMPDLSAAPCALSGQLVARVFEKGGRPNLKVETVDIYPFATYVGYKKPKSRWGYFEVNKQIKIPVILVNPNGDPQPGQTVKVRIYKSDIYWWWEFDRYEDYYKRFKQLKYSRLVKEDQLLTQSVPVEYLYKPQKRGTYLIEFEGPGSNAHHSGFYFKVSGWGETQNPKEAGQLAMKTDKKIYTAGETAKISFPTPKTGSILFTLEQNDVLLEKKWVNPTPEETILEVPITEDMAPNVYASVTILQPHAQTINDRPMRMYGYVPILVESDRSRQGISIKAPETIRPNEKFTVQVQTEDHEQTQVTLAIVDEGLLALTDFKTPDPWSFFNQKTKLNIKTYDIFGRVIGANREDVFQTFSIGGGMTSESYRKNQQTGRKAKRFKPVVLFSPPIKTDRNGKAEYSFHMPNYVGAVRVMAVNSSGNRYGSAEQTIPVKQELMVLPSLPRVLGPGEKFSVPVSIFAMEDNLGEVRVTMETEGPVKLSGSPLQSVTFTQKGDKDLFFELYTLDMVGPSAVKIKAVSASGKKSMVTVHVQVRPSSARIYTSRTITIERGASSKIDLPKLGLDGTNHVTLNFHSMPNLNFDNRIKWLIHYPYGCIEQTTSSVFPQLELANIFYKKPGIKEHTDRNINAGIRRLRRFQLPSGGFSYWPGETHESTWGSLYAGHFLIEARNAGYDVPEDLYSSWLNHQSSLALKDDNSHFDNVYRLYLLALAKKPNISRMNYYYETKLKKLSNSSKYLLAAAYAFIGQTATADRILQQAGTTVGKVKYPDYTWGSALRNKAIILECMAQMGRFTDAAPIMKDIAQHISNGTYWYSTQSLGWALLAIGKYLHAVNEGNGHTLAAEIKIPGEKTVRFERNDVRYSFDATRSAGKTAEVKISDKNAANICYVDILWDGVPVKDTLSSVSKNIQLQVEWLDEDGMRISPTDLSQGKVFYGHFRVVKPSAHSRENYKELALVQVLPSGWEIENTRLMSEKRPPWTKKWKMIRADYVDIRDDRIMFFFNLSSWKRQADFLVKLNAVTPGEFHLPGTKVEAMYNPDIQARTSGKTIRVNK